MSRFIIVIFSLFIGRSALAAAPKTITLDLKLEINNQLITQPQLIAPLGKKSTSFKVMADNSTYVIEVIPEQDVDMQVYLNFTLKKITKGKSVIIAHPRIITLLNQEASVDEGDSATSDVKNVVLSVTPHH